MRLLFIKLKNIGDVLLMTPTIDAVKLRYPEAEISVVVRRGTEGILAGCRSIDHILTTVEPEKENRTFADIFKTLGLVIRLRRQKYDYVFLFSPEDRACFYALMTNSKNRVINDFSLRPFAGRVKRFFKHRNHFDYFRVQSVVRDYELVRPILHLPWQPPQMSFHTPEKLDVERIPAGERTVLLHPVTRWAVKEWPIANWREVVVYLKENFDRVIISVGPEPKEIEYGDLLAADQGDSVISTRGRYSWAKLAALMKQIDLFIGVDTAAMHLAAACDCPMVALFGQSKECVWAPWKADARILIDTTIQVDMSLPEDEFTRKIESRRVDAITVEAVIRAVEQMTPKK